MGALRDRRSRFELSKLFKSFQIDDSESGSASLLPNTDQRFYTRDGRANAGLIGSFDCLSCPIRSRRFFCYTALERLRISFKR